MERGDILLSRTSKNFEIHKKSISKIEKIWFFPEKSRFFKNVRIFENFPEIFIHFSYIFRNFRKIFENSDIFEKSWFFRIFFRFFRFSRWIFYGFQNFLMFWKGKCLLFPSIMMSIYEICSPRSLHGVFCENPWKSAFLL